MKKLLIMSLAMLFSLPNFAQTRTVRTQSSNSASVEDVKKQATDTYNASKKKAAEILGQKKKGTTNSRVTRPSRPSVSKEVTTLTLLDDKPGVGGRTPVTRPSRPSVSDEVTTLTLLDNKPGVGGRTPVTRPHPRGGKPRR